MSANLDEETVAYIHKLERLIADELDHCVYSADQLAKFTTVLNDSAAELTERASAGTATISMDELDDINEILSTTSAQLSKQYEKAFAVETLALHIRADIDELRNLLNGKN